MKNEIKVFDTTLRDGEQAPGYAMSVEDKIRFARILFDLHVDVIETGFPISSRAQYNSVNKISMNAAERKHKGKYVPTIAALARAKEEDIENAASALAPAIEAGIGRIHVFLGTSPEHRIYKLHMTKQDIEKRTIESIQKARNYTDDIEFSLEDASRTEKNFRLKIIEIALKEGARTINIPDTVGYCYPDEYRNIIKQAYKKFPEFSKGIAQLSVHCHNDLGLAVANSLSGLSAGAKQVECTINGIGERAGNAALEEIVVAMLVKNNGMRTNIRSKLLYPASRMLVEITKNDVQPNKAIVGKNAFAHEAGIHQHGVIKNPSTYEIINPVQVGRYSKIILGRHSGKHAVVARLTKLGIKTPDDMSMFMERYNEYADGRKEVSDKDLLMLTKK